jgi:arylsulfatase A-like enzyme
MSWQRAVRDKQYKLIEYCVGKERHTQLYDLLKDPEETRSLAADKAYAGKLADLRKLLQQDRASLNDGNTPFPFSNQQGKDFWSLYESDVSPNMH